MPGPRDPPGMLSRVLAVPTQHPYQHPYGIAPCAPCCPQRVIRVRLARLTRKNCASGMRYQVSSRPDSERGSGCHVCAVPLFVPFPVSRPSSAPVPRRVIDSWCHAITGQCSMRGPRPFPEVERLHGMTMPAGGAGRRERTVEHLGSSPEASITRPRARSRPPYDRR